MKCQLQPGDRIRLVSMPNDPDPVPAGSLGTVRSVHEHGDWSQVDVAWDNGRSLMLCLPGDVVALVSTAKPSDGRLKEGLLRSALRLSESERLELATELLNSVAEHAPGYRAVDSAFIAELERRANDGSPGIPWADVQKSMDDKLGK